MYDSWIKNAVKLTKENDNALPYPSLKIQNTLPVKTTLGKQVAGGSPGSPTRAAGPPTLRPRAGGLASGGTHSRQAAM